MAEEKQVPVAPIGPQNAAQQTLRPHRGTLILVLGILGLVCCFISGIVAWVMGSSDLKEMAAGRMDTSGQGLTQAGKICGMISVILQIVGFVIWFLLMGLGIATSFSR
ncbi:MAG TPA: hypothetical protein VMX36_10535 [Sedimentisphaerales bacterium]|nr:hypothetical protein [Sedimentisphaerales bacterium]